MLINQLSKHYKTILQGMAPVSHETLIEPTDQTPYINLSLGERQLMIKGVSNQENIHHFYYPIIRKLKDYLSQTDEFTMVFFFKTLNSSTAKVLFNIFKTVRNITSGKRVNLYWGANAGDEDMVQIGKDLVEIYDLDMQFFEVSDELTQNQLYHEYH